MSGLLHAGARLGDRVPEARIRSGATLLVIDVQQGVDNPAHGQRSNLNAESNIARLLAAWRRRGWPVIHIHHHSTQPQSLLRPELPGASVKPEAAPVDSEPVFCKTVNSAFLGTDLEAHLRERGTEALVLVGLTADHCVSATARMAGDLGFDTTVVADATAAFEKTAWDGRHIAADDVHAVSLVTLQDEFATITMTATVLDALA